MKLPSSGRVFLRWLKRRLPVTLFGRSLLIIVLPVAIMQIAVTYVFFDAHWQTVTARLSEGLAGDIAWAVESYQEDPRPESFAKLSRRAEDSMSLSIALQPDRRLPLRPSTGRWSGRCRTVSICPSGSIPPAIPPMSISASACPEG